MTQCYTIDDLRPLINWEYFDYAWGIGGKEMAEGDSLHADAETMLDSWNDRHTWLKTLVVRANSQDDDILLHLEDREWRLPMLRQQKPDKGCTACLCLADYIRPQGMGDDSITLFATTVEDTAELHSDDPYTRMLAQTLSDRLAEATAEKMSEMHQGIRPAVGYPSMPDMSLNFLLDEILHMQSIGIRLTESGMMIPHASVSGIVFHHPKAKYFNISRIGFDQLHDYAHRRQMSPEEMQRFIRI